MPIYVYEPTIYSDAEQVSECCDFEVLQSITDKPLSSCPTCGHAIHRAVTSFQIQNNVFHQNNLASGGLQSKNDASLAKNAARLAARHMCGAQCKH